MSATDVTEPTTETIVAVLWPLNSAAYAASLSQCADIVRTHFPEVPHVQ